MRCLTVVGVTVPRIVPRLRRRLRVPAATATGALVAAAAGWTYGGLHGRGLHGVVITLTATLVFVALALSTVRRASTDIDLVLGPRMGPARSSVLALLTAVAGYAITALITLQLLAIPVGQLLLGGAITGIIIGIAAQQSLGNLAAGLVLLLARPYNIGDTITVHSGALGGPHTGTVLNSGLTYTQLHTTGGLLQLPNAGLLAAAINPAPAPPPPPAVAVAEGGTPGDHPSRADDPPMIVPPCKLFSVIVA